MTVRGILGQCEEICEINVEFAAFESNWPPNTSNFLFFCYAILINLPCSLLADRCLKSFRIDERELVADIASF